MRKTDLLLAAILAGACLACCAWGDHRARRAGVRLGWDDAR